MSAAELETHLLPAALPNGWTSHPDSQDTETGSSTGAAAPFPACDVQYGSDVVEEATGPSIASVTADFQGRRPSGGGTIAAGETLYSFAGNGAHQAMQAIRTVVSKCSPVIRHNGSISTYTFAITPGPHLGDESLVVRAEVKHSNFPGIIQYTDATVVRVGSTLIEIGAAPMSRPEVDAMESLMPSAVAQVASAHPKPVGAPGPGFP